MNPRPQEEIEFDIKMHNMTKAAMAGDHQRGKQLYDELLADYAALLKKCKGWECDARMAQASWHAACEDISKLTKANDDLNNSLMAEAAKVDTLQAKGEALAHAYGNLLIEHHDLNKAYVALRRV